MKTVHTLPELAGAMADDPVVLLEVDGVRYVVQDAADYAKAEEERFVASLVQAEADYKAGLGKSVEEVWGELRTKHRF